MPPRTTESPSTVVKRSFDMPRYDEFKERLAERDASPAMFIRRVVLEHLDKKALTFSHLKTENKELLLEISKEMKTADMQSVLESALDQLRLVRRKPKK